MQEFQVCPGVTGRITNPAEPNWLDVNSGPAGRVGAAVFKRRAV